MSPTLPEGSRIELSYEGSYRSIVLPQEPGSVLRYFMGFFLLFWMGGWFMGFYSALEALLSGKANAFLVFWLGAWTVGGCFAIFVLFRIFRRAVPEKLLLEGSKLVYDTGVPPFLIGFGPSGQRKSWESLFRKRRKYEFSLKDLKSLRLRETDSGNRLTMDHGAKRVEIGGGLSEVEREWLYEALRESYT